MNKIDTSIKLMTLGQAATILKVSKRTLFRMIQNGKFPAFQVGVQWRVLESRFQEWLEQEWSENLPKSGE
jgi:excisionase family DNA binding protein